MKTFETYAEKRVKAMLVLARLGAIKFVGDLELYHGRNGDGSDWEVDPSFNNSGDSTGRQNVNKISSLYTGEKHIAEGYAQYWTEKDKNTQPEIHRVVALDKDAVVFDRGFKIDNLTLTQQKEYYAAMEVLLDFDVTEAEPVKFEDKRDWHNVMQVVEDIMADGKTFPGLDKRGLFSLSDLNKLKEVIVSNPSLQRITDKTLEIVEEYVKARNTRILLRTFASSVIRSYKNNLEVVVVTSESGAKTYPMSCAYFAAWARHNHVIGFQQMTDSGKFSENFEATAFFDLAKIMSEKGAGEKIQECIQTFGELTSKLVSMLDSETSDFLTKANSKEVMAFINQSPECKELFNKSAGVWEGWTVGQHTQAVLDFFDRYYQNEFPEQLVPFIKIVMLAHDIGKGYAREAGITQKEGTLQQVDKLYDAINLPAGCRKLINFIITESQKHTSMLIVDYPEKEKPSIQGLVFRKLRELSKQAYKRAFGLGANPSEQELDALLQICITLQNCDSGAYTRYASIQEGDMTVAGGNDRFTKSFAPDKKNRPRLKNINNDVDVK